jgi:uncharacterized membrane protein
MSDIIFLSYASDDRSRIGPLVDGLTRALTHLNVRVWWDHQDISVGKRWDVVLEEALDSAKCVVVVWSVRSTRSQWVSNEASEGMRRGVLLPVLIDNVPIPLGFRHLQAANLVGWSGDVDNPEFRQLCHGVWSLTHREGNWDAASATGQRANFSGSVSAGNPFSGAAQGPGYRTVPEFHPAPPPAAVRSDSVAGGFCYFMGPLSLMLLIATTLARNRVVRFHAFQSTLLWVSWLVLTVWVVTSPDGRALVFFLFFLIYVVFAIATFMGRTPKFPLIQRMARKLAG